MLATAAAPLSADAQSDAAPAAPESSAAVVLIGNQVLAATYVRTATEAIYGAVPRVFVKTAPGGTRTRPVRTH